MKGKNYAILLAGGKGKRLKLSLPKALLELNKKPLFIWSVEKFVKVKFIHKIIIVVPRGFRDKFLKFIPKYPKEILLCYGGKERADSVRKALDCIEEAKYIFIHDCARPFFPESLLSRLYLAVKKYQAVIPAIPVTSTIKKVVKNYVVDTIVREGTFEIQTPQAFEFNLIKNAYEKFKGEKFIVYDDSFLLEKMGFKVRVIAGNPINIKITYPKDLLLARLISGKIR